MFELLPDDFDVQVMAEFLYDGTRELDRKQAIDLIAGHLRRRDAATRELCDGSDYWKELCRANGFGSITDAVAAAVRARNKS